MHSLLQRYATWGQFRVARQYQQDFSFFSYRHSPNVLLKVFIMKYLTLKSIAWNLPVETSDLNPQEIHHYLSYSPYTQKNRLFSSLPSSLTYSFKYCFQYLFVICSYLDKLKNCIARNCNKRGRFVSTQMKVLSYTQKCDFLCFLSI